MTSTTKLSSGLERPLPLLLIVLTLACCVLAEGTVAAADSRGLHCTAIATDSRDLKVGEKITLEALASHTERVKIIFTWSTTGGSLVGTGSKATFDASGLEPGPYTVTVRVSDPKGHWCECTLTLSVRE